MRHNKILLSRLEFSEVKPGMICLEGEGMGARNNYNSNISATQYQTHRQVREEKQ